MQCLQRQIQDKQHGGSSVHLNIYAILKSTACDVISSRDPRRWDTLMNLTRNYSVSMNGGTFSHERALCAASVTAETENTTELSHKVRACALPYNRRARPKMAPCTTHPVRDKLSICTVGGMRLRLEEIKKTVYLARAEASMFRPWQPECPFFPPRFFPDHPVTSSINTVQCLHHICPLVTVW